MIRFKIILIIAASITLLTVILYFTSVNLLLKSYSTLEYTQMLSNTARVESTFKTYEESLKIRLAGKAQWDNTYQFVQDFDTNYITSNVTPANLFNLDINYMVFVSTTSEIIFSEHVEFSTMHHLHDEDGSLDFIHKQALIAAEKDSHGIGGILQLPEGLIFVESSPILKTNSSGPSAGTLIFARFIDSVLLEQFKEITQLDLEVFSYNSPSLPQDITSAKEVLVGTQSILIQPTSEDIITSYLLLNDINNNPVGIARVHTPREIYAQGKKTVVLFSIIATVSSLIFGILIIVLIENLLLRRFTRLEKEVDDISISNLKNSYVQDDAKDEIGILAKKINILLRNLSEAQEKERDAYENEKVASMQMRVNLEKTEMLNKVMLDRELKMIELKEQIAVLQRKLNK